MVVEVILQYCFHGSLSVLLFTLVPGDEVGISWDFAFHGVSYLHGHDSFGGRTLVRCCRNAIITLVLSQNIWCSQG